MNQAVARLSAAPGSGVAGPGAAATGPHEPRKPRRRRRRPWSRDSPRPLRRPVPWTPYDTVVFAIVAILGAVTRFAGLSHPTDNGTPVFDEKHYVPQTWQILRSTDPSFTGRVIGGIEDDPGFGLVVHPPVAKQVMSVGQWLLGYSPLGWRLMSAVFGVVTLLLLMDLVRRIAAVPLATLLVGLYGLFDGVLFVSSRVGMLDMIQTGFVVAAAWALFVDRDRMAVRLLEWRATAGDGLRYGPYLSWRWWRLAAGVFLGLALGVKWSGVYYIAAFGLLTVFLDVADRRRAGVRRPVVGALRLDVTPALRDIVLVPLIVYALSWRSWFAQETSVYRHLPADQLDTGLPSSVTAMLPDALARFIHYQRGVLEFHSELTTSGGHHHPWESKPWEWLWSGRPMLYYSAEGTCMGGHDCRAWQMLFGTPPIWWLLVPVMLWALWRWIGRRDRRFALPCTGFIASWLPWAIAYDRQMYFFYATALIPFVLMAMAVVAADLAGWTWRGRRIGLGFVVAHLALVIAAFAFWAPIMAGIMLPEETFNLRFWLPSWT
ncbi:dolichyl-phosphate-mannose--protein mannosyltransferase [Corynebacterium sp.]|uniref:dolichyl-phosphate-mannose--protein mannosyltransferase n=1 Tax=Corynebacterium sp. TaxID=1720 RepID=UPI0026DAE9EA|nr:phospholipid carrier-dependent glycosyltransferase [Corynebacterium sp.]MDO4611137.1 phospholipid carrier-dependent glycosyltransferase [Corynebacterium sp.]